MFTSTCNTNFTPTASFMSVMNNPGTFTTDFVGSGGDTIQVFSWTNSAVQADYAMDITATTSGRVDITIRDADQTLMASFFLDATSPDDTINGLTFVGTPGTWTIELDVQNFVGDGSLNVNSAGTGD